MFNTLEMTTIAQNGYRQHNPLADRYEASAAFDKAYIDREVDYHAQVIDAIDKTLIPNAQNTELKDLLVKYRPAFVGHLEHAKQIQAKLAK